MELFVQVCALCATRELGDSIWLLTQAGVVMQEAMMARPSMSNRGGCCLLILLLDLFRGY